ncbi:MAG: LexA family transcriptional regulator [Oscillospiraceae bacterium]|nr:LexA family transcriptional regulator [Oscillospiraceae bacterium]
MEQDQMTQRLNAAFSASGLTQAELARASGIDRASISLYLSGRYHPKADKLLRIAAALGTTPEWLSGMDGEDRPETALPLPVFAGLDGVGQLRGTGERFLVPRAALRGEPPERFFLLRVEGLAMYPRLLEGDVLLVRREERCADGSIVVLIQGELLLVRRLEGQMLLPANPEFPPRPCPAEQRMLGRAITLFRAL